VAAGILSPKALEGGYCRRVPDAIFAHPRLAPIYDVFDGDRDDLAAYLSIADELGADRVLDVGCGTGCLAVLLAASGRIVVGSTRPGHRLKSRSRRMQPDGSPGFTAMPRQRRRPVLISR
jgi:SAM-dependent methyltransferase